MDIQKAIEEGRSGKLRPAYLLVGTETLLIERAVGLLRKAAVGADGVAGFNEDILQGQGLEGHRVISLASTLPMMASRRFVLVRHADAMSNTEQGVLAGYLKEPADTTVLVMTAKKLAANTKLGKAASKTKARFDAKPLKGNVMAQFARGEAKNRGHVMAPDAADALLDALGDDLAAVEDAVERMSLYVGPGQRIGGEAVMACVTRVRADTIWALVDAVAVKNQRQALGAAASLLRDREPPLRILAMLSRQLRMVAKAREALAKGATAEEAAKAAGAPPFKGRALKQAARRFRLPDLESAFDVLGRTDLQLKGASKAPPEVLLELAVLELCQ